MSARLSLALVALALGAGTLQAQTPRYGATLGAALPLGDLKDFNNNAAPVLGGFVELEVAKGHILRPRVELAGTFEKKETVYWLSSTNTVASAEIKRNAPWVGAGVDYLWKLDNVTPGLQLTAGVGVRSMSAKATWNGYETKETSTSATARLGVGYAITPHWGVEASYEAAKFKQNVPDRVFGSDPSAPIAQMKVSYTF